MVIWFDSHHPLQIEKWRPDKGRFFLLSPKSDGCDFSHFEQRDDLESPSRAKRTDA